MSLGSVVILSLADPELARYLSRGVGRKSDEDAVLVNVSSVALGEMLTRIVVYVEYFMCT